VSDELLNTSIHAAAEDCIIIHHIYQDKHTQAGDNKITPVKSCMHYANFRGIETRALWLLKLNFEYSLNLSILMTASFRFYVYSRLAGVRGKKYLQDGNRQDIVKKELDRQHPGYWES
jgi:hypothetical protein